MAEDLGVRYVLEGSVQKSGETVRISAQLVDALAGHHLWAKRCDRDLRDLFALQDEIAHEIVTALRVNLSEGEQARVWRRHTRNLEAWAHLGRGAEHFYRISKEGNALARQSYEKAVEVDPEYGLAYSMLAWTHWQDAFQGWSESRARSIGQAVDLAQKARTLDDSLPDVYSLLGAIHLIKGEYDQAIALGRKAVALSPNHSNNTALLALTLGNAGQPEAAIRGLKRAMRLSPYYPPWYLEVLGFEYLEAGQYEQALAAFGRFLERKPSAVHAAHAHLGRARGHHALGRQTDARAEVARALETAPGLSARSLARHSLDKDKAAVEKNLATLRGLGLPE